MLSIMTSACAALQQHGLVRKLVAARAAHTWKMALQEAPDLQDTGDGTAAEVAGTGVDFLAVGALTHSAAALDIGLDLVEAG